MSNKLHESNVHNSRNVNRLMFSAIKIYRLTVRCKFKIYTLPKWKQSTVRLININRLKVRCKSKIYTM